MERSRRTSTASSSSIHTPIYSNDSTSTPIYSDDEPEVVSDKTSIYSNDSSRTPLYSDEESEEEISGNLEEVTMSNQPSAAVDEEWATTDWSEEVENSQATRQPLASAGASRSEVPYGLHATGPTLPSTGASRS